MVRRVDPVVLARTAAYFDLAFATLAFLASSRSTTLPASVLAVIALAVRPAIALALLPGRRERVARFARSVHLLGRPHVVTVAVVVALAQASAVAARVLADPGPASPVRASLDASNAGSVDFLATGVVATVLVPALFETVMLVRGGSLVLLAATGRCDPAIPWWAFLGPVLLWLTGHLDYQGAYVGAVLFVGVLTLVGYRRDRSLATPVIAHGLFNLVSVLVIFLGV